MYPIRSVTAQYENGAFTRSQRIDTDHTDAADQSSHARTCRGRAACAGGGVRARCTSSSLLLAAVHHVRRGRAHHRVHAAGGARGRGRGRHAPVDVRRHHVRLKLAVWDRGPTNPHVVVGSGTGGTMQGDAVREGVRAAVGRKGRAPLGLAIVVVGAVVAVTVADIALAQLLPGLLRVRGRRVALRV